MDEKTEKVENEELVSPVDAGKPTTEICADFVAPEVNSLAAISADLNGEGCISQELSPVQPEHPVSPSHESAAEFAAQDFKAKTTLAQDAFRKTFDFVKDQKVLVDAFLVALSFHVVMFPVLWTAGWALPWPKPPVVTTLIDYDLREWVKNRKPKNIIEFRDPALNQ